MKIQLLADLLDGQVSGDITLAKGINLFTNQMPSDVTDGILIKVPLAGIVYDHYLPGYFQTNIQFIVRTRRIDPGEALARLVLNTMTMKQTQSFEVAGDTVMIIQQMLPRQKPILYPRSDGNGLEHSINFAVTYWERDDA